MEPFRHPFSKSIAMLTAFLLVPAIPFAAAQPSAAPGAARTQIWRFNRLNSIGGYPTQVLGHPKIIETPYGKAVQFNGVNDALFVPDHPLAGASTYTWEVIFRPDGGAFAQRFFHLQEQDPATGKDTGNRMLFEIRVVNGQWCLDSFASSGTHSRALLNCKLLHPLGRWYRITAVYDGHELRNYVGDQLQGEGPLDLQPQLAGHSSIGVRINKVNWFKGAVLMARFTPRALEPSQFLKMPPKSGGPPHR
jgi:Concanavalin A-like lectin/glucanases superfamily